MPDEITTEETETEETGAPASTTPASTETTEEKPSGKTYDEAYVKKLRQESAGYRTERNSLSERVSELQKENETLKGTTDGTSARVTDLERENARLAVALDKGLPKELVARLVGNTQEELSADADALLAIVNPSGTPVTRPNFDGGNRAPLKAPDLATQITEAEKAGDVKLSMRLKAQMALESRERQGAGAMSVMPPSRT